MLGGVFLYFADRILARHNYEQAEMSAIDAAGNKAAFDLVEKALSRKLDELGMNCHIERTGRQEIGIDFRERTNPLFVSGIGSSPDFRLDGMILETGAFDDRSLARISLLPLGFVSWINGERYDSVANFFKILGFENVSKLFFSENLMWVTGSFSAPADNSGGVRDDGSTYFCPLASFLQQIGVSEKDFILAINAARVKYAATLKPVRGGLQKIVIRKRNAAGAVPS